MKKIPIGISSCLLGEHVRYDGGHRLDTYITGTLSDYFAFQPFCPEADDYAEKTVFLLDLLQCPYKWRTIMLNELGDSQ